MDFEFTASMEEDLDQVEEGKAEWVQIVKHFYGTFSGQVDAAKSAMQTVKRENEPTDEVCEKCGKPMVIKWGRRGRFMSCSGWPECRNAKSISTDVVCPQCGQGKLVARRARSGRGRPFFGCTTYPACTYLANRLPTAGGEETGTPDKERRVGGEDRRHPGKTSLTGDERRKGPSNRRESKAARRMDVEERQKDEMAEDT
jgi:ssDNA-binding Zn-finger/Zn-ribbon topoisomerase 1